MHREEDRLRSMTPGPLLPFLLPSNLLMPFQVQAGDCELTTGNPGLAVSPKMRAIGT